MALTCLYRAGGVAVVCHPDKGEPPAWVRERVRRDDPDRLAGFRTPASRRRFVLSRQAVHVALGCVGVHDAVLGASLPGRPPTVRSPRRAWVSISHTPDVVVAMASRAGPIGVDVERSDRDLDSEGLAPRFCSPDEFLALPAGPSPGRRRALLELWLAKEALSKARGQGLALDFRTLTQDPDRLEQLGVRGLVLRDHGPYRFCWTLPKGDTCPTTSTS